MQGVEFLPRCSARAAAQCSACAQRPQCSAGAKCSAWAQCSAGEWQPRCALVSLVSAREWAGTCRRQWEWAQWTVVASGRGERTRLSRARLWSPVTFTVRRRVQCTQWAMYLPAVLVMFVTCPAWLCVSTCDLWNSQGVRGEQCPLCVTRVRVA